MNKLLNIAMSIGFGVFLIGCGAPRSRDGAGENSQQAGNYGNSANNYQGDANGYGGNYASQGNSGMLGMDTLGSGSNSGGSGMGQLASNANGLPIGQLMPNNGGGDDSGGSSEGGGHARFYPQGTLSGKINGNKFMLSSVLDMKQKVYPSNFQLNPEDNATYLITIVGYDVREDRLIESSGYVLFQFIMPDIRVTGTYDVIYPPSANNAKVTVIKSEDFNSKYILTGYLDNAKFYYMDSNETYDISVKFDIDKGLLQVKPPQQ